MTEVVALLRDGGSGSTVRLTVRHGLRQREVLLRRTVLDADDVTVDKLPGGVTWISLDAFTEGVGKRVAAAVRGRAPVRASCSTCAATRAAWWTRRWPPPRSSSTAVRWPGTGPRAAAAPR
ncbi:hypothetical protein ACFQZC_24135 [Streptacidiphilus monticola]